MSKKSFDQITIQDISDKATVGPRTIYHHYQDKFDLLSKLIEEHIVELRKLCQSVFNKKIPADQLRLAGICFAYV
ncbi:TetR/AcrR family transcriptional regulator [Paenibacillus polymyxa]|nr:TetR/AcrR family transcriptional regulator [Paenibacillus polymyxa]